MQAGEYSHQSPPKGLHAQSTKHAHESVQNKEPWAERIAAALSAQTLHPDSTKHIKKRWKVIKL